MNNTIEYKGYIGSVEFSEEDNLFFGKVMGIRSLKEKIPQTLLPTFTMQLKIIWKPVKQRAGNQKKLTKVVSISASPRSFTGNWLSVPHHTRCL